MTAFCVKINNHLNSFYKWHCAINMDAPSPIYVSRLFLLRQTPPGHIYQVPKSFHISRYMPSIKMDSPPTPFASSLRGSGLPSFDTSTYLRTFVRVSMVLKRVLTWYHASYLRVWQSALPCCVLSTSSHFKMIAFR